MEAKTKKIALGIGSILLIIITIGLVLLYKKSQAAKQLKVTGTKFRIDAQRADILKYVAGTPLPITTFLTISNYSKNSFRLEQINLDIYSIDGVLIASQTLPLNNAVIIKPSENTEFKLLFDVKALVLIKAITKDSKVLEILTSYFTTQTFGKKVVLKGTVRAEGLSIAINETIDI